MTVRELLAKAHIRAYTRRNPKTGEAVSVREHEDKRPPAREEFPGEPRLWSQEEVIRALRAHGQGLGVAVRESMRPRTQAKPPAAPQPQGPAPTPPQAHEGQQASDTAPPRVPVPHSIVQAVQRMQHGASLHEVAMDFAKQHHLAREQVDFWLAYTGHPLADMEGSQADRFEATVQYLVNKLQAHKRGRERKPGPQTDHRAPSDKYPVYDVMKQDRQKTKRFARQLDKQAEGSLLTIPDAPKESGLMGTWEKVTVGGKPFWKKGSTFKTSAEFAHQSDIVKRQLKEGLKKKEEKKPKGGTRKKPQEAILATGEKSASVTREGSVPESDMVEKIPAAQRGHTEEVYTDQGDTLNVQYAVVEAHQPNASHGTDLSVNPHFPEEMQPRDRTQAATEKQLGDFVTNFQPALLGANPKASEGAPMVGPDGVVEIGNGRTIGLRRIYERHPELAEKYKAWVKNNAAKLGIDPKAIEGLKQPMLIRIRKTDVDRRKFVERTNKPSAAKLSAGEQARIDERLLTPEKMALYNPDDDKGLMGASNRAFVRSFLKELDAAEIGDLMDGAELGQLGELRIRNAMLQRAYKNKSLVEKMSQATDDTTRNITNALTEAAPRMASIRAGVEAKQLHPLDIGDDIASAALVYDHLKKTRTSVDDYLRQIDMEGERLSPLGKDILTFFDQHARSAKRMAKVFNTYGEMVEALGSPEQGSFFGGTETPTKEATFQAALHQVKRDEEREKQRIQEATARQQEALLRHEDRETPHTPASEDQDNDAPALFKTASQARTRDFAPARRMAEASTGQGGAETETFTARQKVRKPFVLLKKTA